MMPLHLVMAPTCGCHSSGLVWLTHSFCQKSVLLTHLPVRVVRTLLLFVVGVARPGLVPVWITVGSVVVPVVLVAVFATDALTYRWAIARSMVPWTPACAAAAAEDTGRTIVPTLLAGANGCTEWPRQVATDLQTQEINVRIQRHDA